MILQLSTLPPLRCSQLLPADALQQPAPRRAGGPAETHPKLALAASWQLPSGLMPVLCGAWQNIHLPQQPGNSIFLLSVRIPNAAAATGSGNQAASCTSTHFFTPSLPTVTRVIYCLLPSPLPSVQPRRAAHVNRCHLSEGRSRAPAPFYNASLLMLQ